jgi:hypothetical protein
MSLMIAVWVRALSSWKYTPKAALLLVLHVPIASYIVAGMKPRGSVSQGLAIRSIS